MKTLNVHQEFVLNGMTVSLLLLAQRGVQAITGNPPAACRAQLSEALAPLLGAVEQPTTVDEIVATHKAFQDEQRLFLAEEKIGVLQSAFDSLVNVALASDEKLHGVRIDPETGDLVCDYGPADETSTSLSVANQFTVDESKITTATAAGQLVDAEPEDTKADGNTV